MSIYLILTLPAALGIVLIATGWLLARYPSTPVFTEPVEVRHERFVRH